MKLHQSSRRWRPFWPPFPQHHAERKVRSADSGGWRLNFETPWSSIDSIASLSSVLSAHLWKSSPCQQYRQDDWHFRTTPWKEKVFFQYVLDDIETVDRIKYANFQLSYFSNDSSFISWENSERLRLHPDFNHYPFGYCVFFRARRSPPPKSEGARTAMSNSDLHKQ